MKHLSPLIIFLLFSHTAFSQKYDYRWILGYHEPKNFEVFFSESSVDTATKSLWAYMGNSQVTISDSTGNLLFYCNGALAWGENDTLMPNGRAINDGAFAQIYHGGYYPALQDIMALRSEKNPNIWNLFHYYYELFAQGGEFVWRLYQTQIDMRLNNGLGDVVFKNRLLVQDSLGNYVAACRHGNGRDWWVVCSKGSSNCFYEWLVQPDTVIQCDTQCLGEKYIRGDEGQAVFSPDGSKFALTGNDIGVLLYDFDRCTGKLSNALKIANKCNTDSTIQYGIAFSPNSRFLYTTQAFYVFQFDVNAQDIALSLDTIGKITQLPPDSSFPYLGYYFLMQIAPDGKIYISAANSQKYLHVINKPDSVGTSCSLVNYGLHLPAYNSFGIPSYPNYRLGRMIGSECDTIYHDDTTHVGLLDGSPKRDIRIFPNPATDYIIIDYGKCDWSHGPMQLEIRDESGRIILLKQLPMYSGFQQIDVSQFASSAYQVFIKRNNEIISTSKLIKQ